MDREIILKSWIFKIIKLNKKERKCLQVLQFINKVYSKVPFYSSDRVSQI